MGGGRPAERRFTVGGSGKSVARCHRMVLAYWKFESSPLQRRVRCELALTRFSTADTPKSNVVSEAATAPPIYDDVLIGIVPERKLNNGQPSLERGAPLI